jgi:hypothetical protein
MAEVTDAAGCVVIGPDFLAESGAVALSFGEGGVQLETSRRLQGRRPWVPQAR